MTIKDALLQGNVIEFASLLDRIKDINALDEQGWTLLNWAAGAGNIAIVKLLLEKGANVFCRGRDNRTPYLIALAAGYVDTAKCLKEAEDKNGSDLDCISSRQEQRRVYCRAYPAGALRAFSSWNMIAPESGANPSNEDVVFLHQDFTVTQSVLHGIKVLCAAPTEEWKNFCTKTLGFNVPTDFELLALG